jgi:hypothetical protein
MSIHAECFDQLGAPSTPRWYRQKERKKERERERKRKKKR